MNSAIKFGVVFLVVAAVSGAPKASDNVQLLTDVEDHEGSPLDERQFITQFDYQSVLVGSKKACYTCSSPCSGTRCCDGSYPQCCRVNGVCGCCGFAK